MWTATFLATSLEMGIAASLFLFFAYQEVPGYFNIVVLGIFFVVVAAIFVFEFFRVRLMLHLVRDMSLPEKIFCCFIGGGICGMLLGIMIFGERGRFEYLTIASAMGLSGALASFFASIEQINAKG